MTDEARVEQLLDEIFDSDRTPEEVCADCPELLPEVRKRWQRMRHVDAELLAMFPTEKPAQAGDGAGASEHPSTCRRFRATKCRACSAGAAWVSSTRPTTCALAAWWR
jgi:hypothetical protein